MRNKDARAVRDQIASVGQLVDKIDRSVERIEMVTVIREPNTTAAADAYDGLRKQVIAAVGERTAHLQQLTQFDAALRAGADVSKLEALVTEWLAQSSVQMIEDPAVEEAFEFVGPVDAPTQRVVRPAYVDGATGRVIRMGLAERGEPSGLGEEDRS